MFSMSLAKTNLISFHGLCTKGMDLLVQDQYRMSDYFGSRPHGCIQVRIMSIDIRNGQPWQLQPKRSRSSILPGIVDGQENKDLAIPSTGDRTQLHRMFKRLNRAECDRLIGRASKAMKMMLLANPKGLSKKDRHMFNRVHAPRPVEHLYIICGVCNEIDRHYCSCGYAIYQDADVKKLMSFVSFYRSPWNPVLRLWDPRDQRAILSSLRSVPCSSLTEVFKLCILAGIVGRAESIRVLGPVVTTGTLTEIAIAIKKLKATRGGRVSRGGQRSGLSIKRIPGAVLELAAKAGNIPEVLANLQVSRSDGVISLPATTARREGLYHISSMLVKIANEQLVPHLSIYKMKRIFETIQLACLGGIADLYMHPLDTKILHSVYPLPDTSVRALRLIFPTVTEDIHYRHAVRLLEKWLQCDIACLIPQLCFWTGQSKSRIDWMRPK